jgi:hypothetical protein
MPGFFTALSVQLYKDSVRNPGRSPAYFFTFLKKIISDDFICVASMLEL